LQSLSYTNSVDGTYDTYDVGVDGWSGWIHTVLLTSLETSTTYYYIVGGENDWSYEFNFTTAPSIPIPANHELNFAIVADMGTYIPMGYAVIDQIVYYNSNSAFNMILHAGDVCYSGTGS